MCIPILPQLGEKKFFMKHKYNNLGLSTDTLK